MTKRPNEQEQRDAVLEQLSVEQKRQIAEAKSFQLGVDELRGLYVRMSSQWGAYLQIVNTVMDQYNHELIDIDSAQNIIVQTAYVLKNRLWEEDTELRRIIDVVYGKDGSENES